MASASDSDTPKPCPILEKMSAELRNVIWELAFTPNHDKNEEVELFNPAKSPWKSLLLTCRQIFNEAKGFYQDAYREYWPTTNFVVNIPFARFSDIKYAHFDGEDVDRIRRLQVARGVGPFKSTYIWDQGSWRSDASAARLHLEHNPRSGEIGGHWQHENPPVQHDDPLHKQLLLCMARITDEHEKLKTSGEAFDYLGYWGSDRFWIN